MMKEMKLHVAGLDAFFAGTTLAAQAIDAIDAGGAGGTVATLTFETMETLLTVLTAGRWQLLRSLRRKGPTSIRHLAQLLKRDYRDVHALLAAGLIDRDAEGAISVPWERITAEMSMDLAA
jgi:predicted transcriptional regulator